MLATEPVELAGRRLASRSLDNRLGAYVALEVAQARGRGRRGAGRRRRGGRRAGRGRRLRRRAHDGLRARAEGRARGRRHAARPTFPAATRRSTASPSSAAARSPTAARRCTPQVFELLDETAEQEKIPFSVDISAGTRTRTWTRSTRAARASRRADLARYRYIHTPVETVSSTTSRRSCGSSSAFARGSSPASTSRARRFAARQPHRDRLRRPHALRQARRRPRAASEATELGAIAIRAALERAGVEPQEPHYVIMGQVLQAGAGQAPARQAAVGAGLPKETPADTINKVCASSIRAVEIADSMIRAGDVERRRHGRDGVDVERAVPAEEGALRLPARERRADRLDDLTTGSPRRSTSCTWSSRTRTSSRELGIAREDQDALGAALARARRGRAGRRAVRRRDRPRRRRRPPTRAIRRDTTVERLAALKPVFDPEGTTTAGNAPGVNDGACVRRRLLARSARAKRGLEPLATILSQGYVADDFAYLARTPAKAGAMALERAGKTIDDVERVEINEAFASVALQLDARCSAPTRRTSTSTAARSRSAIRSARAAAGSSARWCTSCAATAAGSASPRSAPAAARATRCCSRSVAARELRARARRRRRPDGRRHRPGRRRSGRRVSLYDAAPGRGRAWARRDAQEPDEARREGRADPDDVLARVEPVDELVPAELMIEAVVEDADVKEDVSAAPTRRSRPRRSSPRTPPRSRSVARRRDRRPDRVIGDALLQPGAGAAAGRGRPRQGDLRRDGRGDHGARGRARQDAGGRERLPGLRLEPDPDAVHQRGASGRCTTASPRPRRSTRSPSSALRTRWGRSRWPI